MINKLSLNKHLLMELN